MLDSANPFALVILTVQAALKSKSLNETDRLQLKLDLAKRLLNKNISKTKIRSFFNFLKFYIRFENRETDLKFEYEIDTITNHTKTMGLEEFLLHRAKREGIETGKLERNTVFTQSLIKNTDFSEEQISNLVGASLDFVKKVKSDIQFAEKA